MNDDTTATPVTLAERRPAFGLPEHTGDSHLVGVSRWSFATRLAFKCFLLYFVIVLAPQVVFFLTGQGWWPRATALGFTAAVSVLRLPAHFASDFLLAQLVGTLALASVSGLVALVWNLLDTRAASYPRSYAWLRTLARFTLACSMVWYGLHKVLPGQFGQGVDLVSLTRQTGQLTPQELLWTFMQASRPYTVFAGVVETASGLLLFSRRAATLGALLAAASMTNVLVMNLAYNVNVKLFSFQLLLMAAFIIAGDARRLAAVLLLGRGTEPSQLPPLFPTRQLDTWSRIVGVLIATSLAYWCYGSAAALAARKAAGLSTPLHGIWEADSTIATATDCVGDNHTAWRYLVFPYEDTRLAVGITASGVAARYAPKLDVSRGSMELGQIPMRGGGGGDTAMKPLRFVLDRPESNQLTLRRVDAHGCAAMNFRRVEAASFPLLTHPWRW